MRLVPLVLVLAVLSPRAHAAESFDGCAGFIASLPATISTQGVWCLDHDLATNLATGAAITVDANNVTIACNGYKLGGLGAGSSTETVGVTSPFRSNTTVRGCNIRGFFTGVLMYGGSGGLVEDNLIESNTYTGINVEGDGTMIRRNRVIDTGGTTVPIGSAYGITTDGAADILDNTVSGVTANYPIGIAFDDNTGGAIVGNRVRGMVYVTASAGIISFTTGRYAVRDNTVTGPGTTGIGCDDNLATSSGNVVGGHVAELSGCTSSGDVINNN